MVLSFVDGRYVLQSLFWERHIPKAAGFRWDPTKKVWWTQNAPTAARLAESADDSCRERLQVIHQQLVTSLAASRATDAQITVPAPPGCAYLPFQRAGIAFASTRPATLIADEPGLGKTIEAIGVSNADPAIRRVLVICPSTPRLNWKREWEKWSVRKMVVGVAQGNHVPEADVVIINYDILWRHQDVLRARPWDLVIVDECHYAKTETAQRSIAILGRPAKRPSARHPQGVPAIAPLDGKWRLMLTGTPIVNRPRELWPLLHWLDPVAWPKFFPFGLRYCAGYKGEFGWDFSGASNLEELQTKLRSTIMLRRRKADVLKELPPKRRQVIEVPANGALKQVQAEQRTWDEARGRIEALRLAIEAADESSDPEVYRAAVEALRTTERVLFTDIARLRHDTAVAKLPDVIAHLHNILDDGDEKLVVFAYHHDVIEAIMREFGNTFAVAIYGPVDPNERMALVDRFQNAPECRLFVGQITAAGVAITLTAASHVVFAELDWVPGNVTQCEDRCHRIGQTNSLLIQHLVLEGSLDARMAKEVVRKQEVADAALDNGGASLDLDLAALLALGATERPAKATAAAPPENVAPAASLQPCLPGIQVAAIHRGLRTLAGMCDGARAKDGSGFGRYDADLGHALARAGTLTERQARVGRKLLVKYRRQLPLELLQESGVPSEQAG